MSRTSDPLGAVVSSYVQQTAADPQEEMFSQLEITWRGVYAVKNRTSCAQRIQLLQIQFCELHVLHTIWNRCPHRSTPDGWMKAVKRQTKHIWYTFSWKYLQSFKAVLKFLCENKLSCSKRSASVSEAFSLSSFCSPEFAGVGFSKRRHDCEQRSLSGGLFLKCKKADVSGLQTSHRATDLKFW